MPACQKGQALQRLTRQQVSTVHEHVQRGHTVCNVLRQGAQKQLKVGGGCETSAACTATVLQAFSGTEGTSAGGVMSPLARASISAASNWVLR